MKMKFLKRIGVSSVVIAMILTLAPVSKVHAASISVTIDNGPTITGTSIDVKAGESVNISGGFSGNISYRGTDGNNLISESPTNPIKVHSIEINGKKINDFCLAFSNNQPLLYPYRTADLTTTDLKGATARLDKTNKIRQKLGFIPDTPAADDVNVTITPGAGKMFETAPTVEVADDKGTVGDVTKKDDNSGAYTCKITKLRDSINVIVKGKAVDQPSATISNGTISGTAGKAIATQTLSLTIKGATTNIGNGDAIEAGWFRNVPEGISISYKTASINSATKTQVLTFTFSGTPKKAYQGVIKLNPIQKDNFDFYKYDMKVKENANAKWDIQPAKKPSITAGAGTNYQKGGVDAMTFRCSGALEDLTGIFVDGNLVNSSNYTLKSGSTILTLKPAYLNSLSVGKHTLRFQYKDDIKAETIFSIVSKTTSTSTKDAPKNTTATKSTTPKTGDTTNMMFLFSLLAISGGTFALMNKKRKSMN